jgi:Putative metallopeptidase
VLFHEVGHALVDQWDLPVVGREEDAVDAFSTIFMTEFVNEGEFALAGADFFYYLAASHQLDEVDFADEHSFDKQRAYSIACWVYGSNPTRYGFLRQFLPVSRRVRCPDEYRRLKKAWFSFLRPHIR